MKFEIRRALDGTAIMEKAGYKAYMDGKAYRPAKETRKAGKKTNGSDRGQSEKEIEHLFR